MKAILRTAAAAAALTLAATPALAAPQPQVQPTDRQATATARIVKPLTLVWAQDLDLGTVLLKNAGAYSATVGVTHAGVFSCPSTNVVCSGATKEAKYTVTGTPGQTVQVNTGNVSLNHPSNDPLLGLLMTVDTPGTVTLPASGTTDFGLGGAITVTDATADGTYSGIFAVTVNY